MNENVDLTKILKNCPKGWKFWSPIFGEIEFCSIAENAHYPIILSCKKGTIWFSKEGLFDIENEGAECLLFPSKDQRDWDKFTAPWYKKDRFDPKTLQPFDKVLVRENYPTENWYAAYFSHIEYDVSKYDLDVYEETPEFIICTTGSSGFCYCIPYNDETKHLVGTEDEAPKYYRYWE